MSSQMIDLYDYVSWLVSFENKIGSLIRLNKFKYLKINLTEKYETSLLTSHQVLSIQEFSAIKVGLNIKITCSDIWPCTNNIKMQLMWRYTQTQIIRNILKNNEFYHTYLESICCKGQLHSILPSTVF